MTKRKTYNKRCPTCKGSGMVGERMGKMYIDYECQSCKGRGFIRCKLPSRGKNETD